MGLDFRENPLSINLLSNGIQDLISHKEIEVVGVLNQNQIKVKKQKNNWQNLQTIEQWKAEFDKHPEWKGLSMKDISNLIDDGGCAFVGAFNVWRKKFFGTDTKSSTDAKDLLFAKKKHVYNYQTIEQWKAEFDKHPEWKGLSIPQMQKRVGINEGSRFYKQFLNWCNLSSGGDTSKREALLIQVLPRERRSKVHLNTLEKWKEELDKHPEWKSLGITEVDGMPGGSSFVTSFNKWCKKQSKGDEQIRSNLVNSLFGYKKNIRKLNLDFTSWKEEFDKHPEWKGFSTYQMQIFSVESYSFYLSYTTWTKRIANGDKKKQKELKEMLFPAKQKSWESFETVEDWKEEFDKNPEWKGFSTHQMHGFDKNSRAFYVAFNVWVNKISNGDKKKQKELKEMLFPAKQKSWESFETVEDWRAAFISNPEWMSLGIFGLDGLSGGSSFIRAFNKWLVKNKIDSIKRRELFPEIYIEDNFRWIHLVTLNDWKNTFNKHPEWNELDNFGLKAYPEGLSFKSAFRNWCKKTAKSLQEYKNMVSLIYPHRRKHSFKFDGVDNMVFDSYPERLLGIILFDLGLICQYKDRYNLHIRTNGKKANSIDFRVGDIFLEYHPVGPYERKHNLTFTDTAKRKYTHITNQGMKGRTNLYVFDDVDTLFEIIKEDKELQFYIRNPKYRAKFEKDDWNDLVKEAYRKSVEFDRKHSKDKKEKNGSNV